MRHALAATGASLLDLLLPGSCYGCGRAGGAVCPACRPALAGPARPADPSPRPAGLPAVYAAATYADTARRLVLSYKERGALELTAPLGVAMARAVARAVLSAVAAGRVDGGPVLLVPVPASRAAWRERGFDHVARLARTAVPELTAAGLPTDVAPLLRHARRVVDQAGLGAAQRRANMAAAFAVRPRAVARLVERPPPLVLLVDDIVTTGSTLAEAAAMLAAAGVPVYAAAVVAATPRRRPPA